MRRCLFLVCVIAAVLIGAGQAGAGTVADSVSEFSGVQGQDNWYYGYYDGGLVASSFSQLPYYDPVFSTNEYTTSQLQPISSPTSEAAFGGSGGWYLQWAGGYWTSLWTNGGHANQPEAGWDRQGVEQWAVRRWISEVSGPIVVSGSLATINGGYMMASTLVDGNVVFSQQVPEGGANYSFSTTVSVGSIVDFVIAPDNYSVSNGATQFTATIDAVPEPASLVLWSGLGIMGLIAGRRRKRVA